LRVLPGRHGIATLAGSTQYFLVADDGAVGYDAALEGCFTGAGTTTLAVRGRAVTIDAAGLPVSSLLVGGEVVVVSAAAPVTVYLLPGV
jgi:hypothetical protein